MKRAQRSSPALVTLLPLAALLAGCESGGGGGGFDLSGLTGGGNDRVEYRCDDDRELRVSYNDGGDRATVDAGDRTWRLERTDRGGDRRVYGDDGVTLTVEGDQAHLRIPDGNDYTDCEEA